MPTLVAINSLRVSHKRWTKLKVCQMEVLIQKRERSRHSVLKAQIDGIQTLSQLSTVAQPSMHSRVQV